VETFEIKNIYLHLLRTAAGTPPISIFGDSSS